MAQFNLSGKYVLVICYNCRVLGRDLVVATYKGRDKCLLCGRLTKPFVLQEEKKIDVSKYPKGVRRFPRELAANAEQQKIVTTITERCHDFDCPGKVIDIKVGPVVTEYKFQPDRFTRIKRLKNITEDLAMALSAENISMVRLPGEAALGIYIPNAERKTIKFDETMKAVIAHRYDMELPINLGTTSVGEPYIEDLTKLPHLLIAGQTGSGKSVLLNCILTSLLNVRSPKELQLILADPKSVELFQYADLPHMWMGNRPEAQTFRILALLSQAVEEMKRRTANLHGFNCKNIKEYNDKVKAEAKIFREAGHVEQAEKHLDNLWPYIIIVIDEMSDLVMTEKKLTTEMLAAISAMSRAAGIHLICATQRPSVDVLSGKIKVNFPARVAFRVPASQDSKTILNAKGAETLLGKGDMFYVSPNKPGVQRIHAPWTTQEDVDKMKALSIAIGHFRNCPADAVNGKLPPRVLPEKNGKKMVGKEVN
jgi:DNA segregation ATPase FtsK/SpoIIIE, S-DNA-T family